MEPLLQKILVVGGNGFVGSAVCRAALSRGFQVTSISASGRPYTTPKGHSPAWTSKVTWLKGDALNAGTYAHLLPGVTGVVHTLGTLLEDARYKAALKEGNVPALLRTFVSNLMGGSGNPLEDRRKKDGYEVVNYEAAIRVCEAFMVSKPEVELAKPRAFVYVSAEDIFRPFIPPQYIEAKRRAELDVNKMMALNPAFRGVYVRPSLIYHPHFRPLSTPIAVALDASASIHSSVPKGVPTPAGIFRAIAGSSPSLPSSLVPSSPLASVANALTIPPVHVDHVGQALCIAADNERDDVRGVVNVQEIRRLTGWAGEAEEGDVRAGQHA